MNVRQNLVPSNKYNIKCPYSMTPEFIVVHNTYNDASANNEISYMISNDKEISFHFAVDDKEVVQGIPLNRNAWHSSDGGSGKGNRKGIAIEICYSKSGGDRFIEAEKKASEFVAQLLRERNWGIDKVKKHQDFANKYCPHRTLDMGWQRFLNMISSYLGTATTTKSTTDIAKEVIAGKWGNGATRKVNLERAGYNYSVIQAEVNRLLGGGSSVSQPTVNYYPKYGGNSGSIVEGLRVVGIDSSYNNRSKIAIKNGISGYTGTATQNTKMLNLLKQGKLIK